MNAKKLNFRVATLLPFWAVDKLQRAARVVGEFERARAIDEASREIKNAMPERFRG